MKQIIEYKEGWEYLFKNKIEELKGKDFEDIEQKLKQYGREKLEEKKKELERGTGKKVVMASGAFISAIVPGGGVAFNGTQSYSYAVKCAKGFGLIAKSMTATIIKGLIKEVLVAAGLEFLVAEVLGEVVPVIGNAVAAHGAVHIPEQVLSAMYKKALGVHLEKETIPNLLLSLKEQKKTIPADPHTIPTLQANLTPTVIPTPQPHYQAAYPPPPHYQAAYPPPPHYQAAYPPPPYYQAAYPPPPYYQAAYPPNYHLPPFYPPTYPTQPCPGVQPPQPDYQPT